jgi:uncharacterized protein (DUF58 family)
LSERATRRIGWLLIILLLFMSLVIHNSLLFLLDALVLIVIGASWLWGRYCLAGVTYARHFTTERLFFGEEADLWIEIVNAKPLPLTWLKTEDEFPKDLKLPKVEWGYSSKGQRQTLVNLFSLRWYERVRRRYRLIGNRRGAFDIGPVMVSSGDLFGFRLRREEIDYRHLLLVYPKLVPIEQLGLKAAWPLGDYGSDRRVIEDPLQLAGARDYRPGDSIRHIHWKATSRRSSLQTKVFDPSAAQHLIVCLNTQTLDHIYEGLVSDFFETAIVVAASLAHAGLESRRTVGLVANSAIRNSDHCLHIPASRHSAQQMRILEALAKLTYPPLSSFEDLLRLEAPLLPFGATILAVSAIVNESILAALLELRLAGHPIALIVVGRQPQCPLPSDLPVYFIEENWTELRSIDFSKAVYEGAA